MKPNYKAWEVKMESFYKLSSKEEKIRFLVNYAVLAPSSHNTQPWLFFVDGEVLKVFKEKTRRLPIADTNDRQLFISIGCAIENIITAADFFGYSSSVEYITSNPEDNLVAKITFKEDNGQKKYDQHLIKQILLRKTNRNKYNSNKIDERILSELKSVIYNNSFVTIIDEKEKIKRLGEIAVLSSINSMENKDFRLELSQYVKNNLTFSKIGMPGFTQGLPTPISFLLPFLIKRFNMEKVSKKKNQNLFNKYTPYLVVISTINDDKKDWLEAGRIFQKLSLVGTKHQISFSPWGAPIQIGDFYKEIKHILNSSFRPQLFFRMGYAKNSAKFSPRMGSQEVMR